MPDNRPRAGQDTVWEVQVLQEHLLEELGEYTLMLTGLVHRPSPPVAHNALPN
jgi:hypothetical protein